MGWLGEGDSLGAGASYVKEGCGIGFSFLVLLVWCLFLIVFEGWDFVVRALYLEFCVGDGGEGREVWRFRSFVWSRLRSL